MHKLSLSLLFLSLLILANAQTSQTFYYRNAGLEEEVAPTLAKFSKIITERPDGTVCTEIKNLKSDIIIRSETFKGNEPYGIWKYRYGKGYKTFDYNFPLVYTNGDCENPTNFISWNIFEDYDSLGYKAPKIASGETNVFAYIAKNTFYPLRAKDNGTQGVVYVQFNLGGEGRLEDIEVFGGADILLDKEAVRVLRELRFSSPPSINGKAISLMCLRLPLRFSLR